MVEVLLEAGADVNRAAGPYRMTPLCIAAERKEGSAVVPLLLRGGAEVNVQYDEPRYDEEQTTSISTPLLAAARDGNTPVVRLLLEAGADVRAKENATLLCAAGDNGSAELIRVLVAAGADVKAMDEKGNTAIHLLAHRCWWEKDFDPAAVKLLLEGGASAGAKNKEGKTPLDLIPEDQRQDPPADAVVELLRQAAAAVKRD